MNKIPEREELWEKVLEDLKKVGEHLNTVGNSEFNRLDYYYMNIIIRCMTGYEKIYK